MNAMILHVFLFFLESLNGFVFANPRPQNIDRSAIEKSLVDRDVDLTASESVDVQPTDSQFANPQPVDFDFQSAECLQHSSNGLKNHRRDEKKRLWCRPKLHDTLPPSPAQHLTNPEPTHRRKFCPLPEFPLLVTCPFAFYSRGGLDFVIIGGVTTLVEEFVDQCAPGKFIRC